MKNTFNILLYISFVFVIIALIKADYLIIPTIYSLSSVLISIVFVFLGFILDGFSWKITLQKCGFEVNVKDGIASSGIAVFTKYIPGKVWVILGRSSYIAKLYNYSSLATSTASLQAQLIALWAGMLIATPALIGYNLLGNGIQYWLLAMLIALILLSVMIFHNGFLKYTAIVLKKVLKKEVVLPSISLRKKLSLIPYFVLPWLAWSIGFYFLMKGISVEPILFKAGFSYPLAATLGIIAIFSPGGLGIREGALIAYLSMIGLDITTATTISLSSRLWFLIGEVLIFITGLLFKRKAISS